MKNKYERRLRDEKEANTKLKGETGIMRKKFNSLQREIEDHKEEIKKYHVRIESLHNTFLYYYHYIRRRSRNTT